MNKPLVRAAATAGAVALAVAAAAVPASAFTRDDVLHMTSRAVIAKDVPVTLAVTTDSYFLTVSADAGPHSYLCGMPASDASDADWVSIQFPTKKSSDSRVSLSGKTGFTASVSTTWFPSAAAAKKAFDELAKKAKSCTGTTTQSWTSDDGSVTGQTQVLVNGVVKAVTVDGVISVFVHRDNESTSTGTDGDFRDRWDSYDVYTLAGDAIVNTTASPGTNRDLTKREVNGANDLAKRAAELWLG